MTDFLNLKTLSSRFNIPIERLESLRSNARFTLRMETARSRLPLPHEKGAEYCNCIAWNRRKKVLQNSTCKKDQVEYQLIMRQVSDKSI